MGYKIFICLQGSKNKNKNDVKMEENLNKIYPYGGTLHHEIILKLIVKIIKF